MRGGLLTDREGHIDGSVPDELGLGGPPLRDEIVTAREGPGILWAYVSTFSGAAFVQPGLDSPLHIV